MRSHTSAYVLSKLSVSLRRCGLILPALLCLLVSSCHQTEEGYRILSPNKFSNVLADVYLTEAMLGQMDAAKKIEWTRGLQPKYFQDVSYQWILEKYHITEDDFYATVSYYSGKGHDMIEILDKVESKLKELKSDNDELMAIAEKEEKLRLFELSWQTVDIDPCLSILCAEMTRLDSLYKDELSRSPRVLRQSRVLAVEKEWKKNYEAGLVKLDFTKDGLTIVSGCDTTRHSRYFNRRIDALEKQYQELSAYEKKDTTGIIPDTLLLNWKDVADIMEPVDAGLWTVLTDSVWFRMLNDTSWTKSDLCLRGGICQCGDSCQCKDSCSCDISVSAPVEYLSAYQPWNNEMGHLWSMAIRTREAIQQEKEKHHYPSEIFEEVILEATQDSVQTKAQLRRERRQEIKMRKSLEQLVKESGDADSEKQQARPQRKSKRKKEVLRKMVVPANTAQEEQGAEE